MQTRATQGQESTEAVESARKASDAALRQPGEAAEGKGDSVGVVERQSVRLFEVGQPLVLECGESLAPIDVAYETYGQLTPERDNAILLIHALSGDAHVAGKHRPEDDKPGWWDIMVGPGKPFDTDRYFVICSNALGGCMGATGPSSINPQTKEHYGLSFPMITISDMVEVQRHLIDHLGIEKLLAVAGGSMGGMQVLDWAIRYPDRVAAVLPIATTARLGAQSIAFDAVGRNAILRDKNFQDGAYYHSKEFPAAGLAVARMVAHITYLSEEAMHAKFGRKLQHADNYKFDFDNEFSVETYLDHQGNRFVDRFDANTYLYFSKAMDYFDLSRRYGDVILAVAPVRCRFLVISYSSDWLFPPRQSQEIVNALIQADKEVAYSNIECSFGHDSFLLESKVQGRLISGFLEQTLNRLRGIKPQEPTRKPTTAGSKNAPATPAPIRRRPWGSIITDRGASHRQIEALIEPGTTVLDLGCGDGELMERLIRHKNACGMGVTLGEADVIACTQRGVNVVQYDLDEDLGCFRDQSYDTVVLSQTLQVIRRPETVLAEMLRIGRQVIVSFPNFAYWRYRFQILFGGKAPIGDAMPRHWYDKTSANYLSIRDFEEYIRDRIGARIVDKISLSSRSGRSVAVWPNFFADEAIFVIAQKK